MTSARDNDWSARLQPSEFVRANSAERIQPSASVGPYSIKETLNMSEAIPSAFTDLFRKQALAHLATLNADGSPQVTPVWVDFDGTNVMVNTARGRVKDRNLQRDSRVALTVTDPANPYRYLGIQGRVVKMTEEGADAHIDKMAKKYLNQDKYPFRRPDETRVLVTIEPIKVHTVG
jgi:PPOX class probable F420-dependent enzyme